MTPEEFGRRFAAFLEETDWQAVGEAVAAEMLRSFDAFIRQAAILQMRIEEASKEAETPPLQMGRSD